jgi:hypothetical protein
MPVSSHVPWWAKIGAKIILSRVPFKYNFWKRVSIFEHGSMEEPGYAFEVFRKHLKNVSPDEGFVSLELGPGDSLFSALLARAFGGRKSFLVDIARFASDDMQRYQKMATYLESIGLESPEVENVDSISRLLEMCSARYLTNGLKSLRTIPSSSVDFMWSQAVLEHVRRSEFLDTMVELRRIVRGNGACSHRIDLRDHLGGQLNHLRFSEQVWESDFMSTSGFYTNRIRFPKMMELFREAGFEPKVMQKDTWDQLPTARSLMDEAFREYSDSDLCVSGFDVVLIPVQ